MVKFSDKELNELKQFDYFMCFDEGDNITITADFLNKGEEFYNIFLNMKRQIHEKDENIEILQKVIKILLKEIDDNDK